MVLVEQVRRKLNITWEDDDTDRRVQDIIDTVKPVLRYKLGIADVDYDFSVGGLENMLFLALCLYTFNHVENEFDANYANAIMQCRALHEVAYHKAQEGEADGESS